MSGEYNESRKLSSYKYKARAIKRIPLDVQKTYFEDVLQPAAAAANTTVNGFIKAAIAEKIERLNT